jgi:hypothetical protein
MLNFGLTSPAFQAVEADATYVDAVFADRGIRNTIDKIDQKSYTEWYHIRANLENPLYRNSEYTAKCHPTKCPKN